MKEKKKLSWALFITLGSLVLTIVLAISVFQIYLKSMHIEKEGQNYDDYYVMIVEDRKSVYWQEMYNGAYMAGLEENAYVDLLEDNLFQNYDKYELMEIAIYSEVDGIMVEADESARMTELIDQAVANDIPVVTLYSDNSNSMRCSYVGLGNYELGREYGKQVLKIADANDKSVTVAVLVSTQASDSSQNIVWSGIKETILQGNEKSADIELSLISVDDSSIFTVEESIRDIFMQESLPDIIICLNEINTICTYQAVIDHNKVGDIAILGYYDNDTILKGIYRGVITSTISIDAEQMGQYCIDALTEYKKYGNTSEYFMADITLIDKRNVANYVGGDANGTR